MSLRPYDKEWLNELCKNSHSYSEVLRKAGRAQGGGSQTLLKKKIEEFNIDTSHFTGQGWNKGLTRENNETVAKISRQHEKYTFDDIFIENSSVTQKVMRSYIKRYNLIEYKCQKCGCNGEWQDGIIALEIHHIDGNNKNNLLTNLQWLCPNCHALTDNYKGKNIKAGISELA